MWTEADYSFDLGHAPTSSDLAELAGLFDRRVFRTTFDSPGFALVKFDAATKSMVLRRAMVELKAILTSTLVRRRGRGLSFLSMGRFDQQVTTRFHLDGAPEESILILGYEPSAVRSRIWLADYSRSAFDRGLSPSEYLERYNPMFPSGEAVLDRYITEVESFDSRVAQILMVNNSRTDCRDDGGGLLGVLHKAKIVEADPQARRVVNSVMMVTRTEDDEAISPATVGEFVATDRIAGGL